MEQTLKITSLIFACVIASHAAKLPSFITPCSRNLSNEKLSECITLESRNVLSKFAKGVPELGIEPIDPLTLSDLSTNAGTFKLKSTNVVVKGLRKVDIKEMTWDLDKKTGLTRVFGNLTFTSDYETDGRLLLIPITGKGKLTVKMYNTDIKIKWNLRTYKDVNGVEHLQTYDTKTTQNYGNVKIHLSNILGSEVIGDTINQVLNENWRELMAEVGPPFVNAVSEKVHVIINKLYSQIPYDQILTP